MAIGPYSGTAAATKPLQLQGMNGMAALRAKRKKAVAQAQTQQAMLPKAAMPAANKQAQMARFAAMTRTKK
jgi:hypothetical protein